MELREYLDRAGRSPFAAWFESLDAEAAARVTVALSRLALRNLSNAKPLGGGISEFRLHVGPGYRIYFGQDGRDLIILVGGGTKKRQHDDIEAAKHRWQDYKSRKP